MITTTNFSDAPITSYWVSHIACFGFLVLLNSSNSILVRGVYIDAEEDGTQCVDFPCYYVRLLVQVRNKIIKITIIICNTMVKFFKFFINEKKNYLYS
jgi:hypothetical protein